MLRTMNIWVIGGDPRQAVLAKLLAEDGHVVHTYALERGEGVTCEDTLDGIGRADCVILPLPAAGEGGLLNAPLSGGDHPLTEVLDRMRPRQLVCAGMVREGLAAMAAERRLVLRDYYAREELAILNAVATAEGAIQIAMEELPVTIHDARVLIVGFGRLGQALAPRLRGLGARVWAAARRCEQRSLAESMGLGAEGLERLNARDIRVSGMGERTLRPQETGFFLTENGEEFGAFTEDCHPSREQQTLLLLSLCARKNGKLFDLPGVPRIDARLAPLCEADESEACQRQRTLMGDGLAALFALAEELKQGPLAGQLTALPEVHILTEDVACKTRDKGRILHTLCDQTRLLHSLGEGVRIQHEKGYATIVPDAHRGMVRVMSESPDSEFAKELCDFYLRQIRNITEDKNLPSQTP